MWRGAVWISVLLAGLLVACGDSAEEGLSPEELQERLTNALLSVDDSPGWSLIPPEQLVETSESSCPPDLSPANWGDSLAAAEINLRVSEARPQLSQGLSAYGEDEAAELLSQIGAAIDACSETTTRFDDGTEITFRLSPLDVDASGNQFYATRGELVGVPMTADMILVREGGILMRVLYMSVGASPSLDEINALLEMAVEKIKQQFP